MKTVKQFISVAFIAALLMSCSEDLLNEELVAPENGDVLVPENANLKIAGVNYCGSDTFTLWAGQTIDAGDLIVSNDETNLYVTVVSNGGFTGDENIKMWLGTDFSLLNGAGLSRPAAGGFPYKTTVSEGETTYTFTVALNAIPFYDVSSCGNQAIHVVVHADVIALHEDGTTSEETAWGGDTQGPGKAWWFYTDFVPACCEVTPPNPSEELGTAFAKGNYVFTISKKANPENLPSLNLSKNRWGWAVNLRETGSFNYELWVGAGLNDVSKGILVGNVSIDYDGSQATITYSLFSGYTIEESHIYAGDFRPETLAPGQYGNTMYFDPYVNLYSVTIEVSDTNEDGVWFIIHAVAYGEMAL